MSCGLPVPGTAHLRHAIHRHLEVLHPLEILAGVGGGSAHVHVEVEVLPRRVDLLEFDATRRGCLASRRRSQGEEGNILRLARVAAVRVEVRRAIDGQSTGN